jgi:hypothetical protein
MLGTIKHKQTLKMIAVKALPVNSVIFDFAFIVALLSY